MTTRNENIFRIRSWLDDPYPQAPNLHKVVQVELSEEVDVLNKLNNTGKAWTVLETTVTSSPTQDTYTLSPTNFGKPLYVVKATNNPYQPYVSVPFGDVTDQNYGQTWGQNFFWQANPTFEKMSFYRTGQVNQVMKVSLEPIPQTSQTYTISYLAGYMGNDDPLTSTIAIPEHATLIQLRSAMALLPYCKWSDDNAFNSQKKQELAAAFDYQLARKESLFVEYISSLAHAKMVDCDTDWR